MIGWLKNYYYKRRLKDPKYLYLFDLYDGDEIVSIDCETTGLDIKKDEILVIGAVKIKGNTILTSQKLQLLIKPQKEIKSESIKIHHIRECDAKNGMKEDEAIFKLLDFIGQRPLIGYYLEFDVAMINKSLKRLLNIELPNKQIEISALYYDKKIELIPQANIDLRFDVIMKDLGLPILGKHNAINDAIMVAMMYLKLKDIKKL